MFINVMEELTLSKFGYIKNNYLCYPYLRRFASTQIDRFDKLIFDHTLSNYNLIVYIQLSKQILE